jgi:transcriptional regulator with XRE-family HTH domain
METEILKMVGNRIRQVRKEKGLSQEQVGELADFHYSYIGRIERGEKNISLLTLSRIANALKVGVHQLFSYALELEELTDKEKEVREILHLLMSQDQVNIKRAKNILIEVFNENFD